MAVDVNPGGGTQSVLFVRPLDSLTATPIPTTTGAESPFFSPDGAWIGYWDAGELRRVPVSGVDDVHHNRPRAGRRHAAHHRGQVGR